ncbi:ribose 5-phosphate isomerase A [Siphonobacter sp. BAB-5405]|uniref:ribose-5-phosphate isomerase RpiA n=1 Tax=Siphonobacter sp. BAB-5405 TaxID=1864825 RepID=UPI000C7F8DF1|nr:ribose-5-phosphate isomerase RpiA [Siphonobacter sp. BAB-5405]PMD90793.1 ribose 5-phosphate isomerase A [Siphonobacter sp. BAB-5405]
MTPNLDKEKQLAAEQAVQYIQNDQIVGLGTGSSAVHAVQAIGRLVQEGLRIQGVPTSIRTKELAESLGIPLLDINEVEAIDLTIDGADEFTTDLMLIKGGGGALLREKIVASLTRRQIIITDSSKKVEKLGKFKLPIEVIPFASHYVMNQLNQRGGKGVIRPSGDKPFLTDQGNYIVDTDFGLIEDPAALAHELKTIEGLVGHGLFINLTHEVIMGMGDTTQSFR